jgi:ribosomal protein L37AE/L43A
MRDIIRHEGHIAEKGKVCEVCGSKELKLVGKDYLKCENCGKLHSKKHKFVVIR